MKEYNTMNGNAGIIEIARVSTVGTENRRDIVRRLMEECDSFKLLFFPDALAQYRSYERLGLVVKQDDHIVIYHDCN